MGRIVGKPKNQSNAKDSQKWRRSNKLKSKEMVNSKGDENLRLHTHVEKNGVSTTMEVSTKWPNEDYARLSCQLKERPQLVCQKRISNGFVHLPWRDFSSLFCLQA